MKPTLATLLLPLLLSVPSVARAQAAAPSDADRVTARALAHEGYEAQTHGDYAQAADRFRRAEALVPAPTLRLGLARAQAGMGKLVEAHETYRHIVRGALAPDAPAPFVKAVDDARVELAALEPRLAWVTIDVVGPPESAVTLVLDDAPFPAGGLGTKRASDPGQHRVRASAPGFEAAASTFVVKEGEATAVSLSLRALPEGVAPASPVVPPAGESSVGLPPRASSTPAGKTLGILLFGVGTVGLVGGGVTGVLASTKHASLIGSCPGGHCPASTQSQVDTYDTLGTVSTVSLAAGAACAVVGLVLLLTTHVPPNASPVTAYAGYLDAGVRGTF
jgi:hypothetical protein